MKHVLISLMCCLLFATQGLSFESLQQRIDMRVSKREKDVDWSQKFLDVLKHLSAEHLHHRLSREEYTANLNKIRDAILTKKYREEKKKAEEDRDSEMLRNTILLEPSLPPSPTLTRINEFDRILNVLDKLMIRMELTTVTATPTTLETISKKANDEILKALSTSGLQDISEIQYNRQTERDLTQFQNPQYRQNPPNQSGFAAPDSYNQPPALAPYIQPIQPALNSYQSVPQTFNQPAPQSFNQPGQMQLYNPGQPAGYNQPAVAIYPAALPVYSQQNQQSPGQSQEEESDDADQDTNDQDDNENSKPTRRLCSRGRHKPGCQCKKGCRRPHRDNGDENGDKRETHDQNNEEDEKTTVDNRGNILDTVIFFLIAVVATQVCILAFLIILKDKFIVCLQFKYGQIKMCSMS